MKAQTALVLLIGILIGFALVPHLDAQAQGDDLPTIEAEYQFEAGDFDLRYYFTRTPGLLGNEYLLLYWHDPARGLIGYSCQIDHAIQVQPARSGSPQKAA